MRTLPVRSATALWRTLCAALLVLLCIGPARADTATLDDSALPQVSLVTFGPGSLYWERFGHDALLLRDPHTGEATAYNYGIFDFNDANFLLNFTRGVMRYRVAAYDFEHDLNLYRSEGRWVVEQPLNLTPQQRAKVRDYLQWNMQPENIRYLYDYFVSNCATRARDVIDLALDGQLKAQLEQQKRGPTYRSIIKQLMTPEPLLRAGMDLGLGPRTDEPLTLWDESFIPMALMDALREVHNTDGQPLVTEQRNWLAATIPDPPAVAREWTWPAAFIGLASAAFIVLLSVLRPRATAARIVLGFAAALFYFTGTVLGLIIALAWAFTQHWGAIDNVNLLLVNPLSIPLAYAWLRTLHANWQPIPLWKAYAAAIAALAALSPFAAQLVSQHNAPWVLLLLPTQLALAWALHRIHRA